jgi:hypothetical protein
MEHSLKNEKNKNESSCDIFINEVLMEENNVEEDAKVNPSLQSEIFKNLKIENEEKMMKQNLKTLHNQRKLCRLKGRNVLC